MDPLDALVVRLSSYVAALEMDRQQKDQQIANLQTLLAKAQVELTEARDLLEHSRHLYDDAEERIEATARKVIELQDRNVELAGMLDTANNQRDAAEADVANMAEKIAELNQLVEREQKSLRDTLFPDTPDLDFLY